MANRVQQILEDDFGVGIVVANPTTIVWAAEQSVQQHHDVSRAKADLKEINRIRTKHGAVIAHVPFGHPLF
jgi:hypothetical protein